MSKTDSDKNAFDFLLCDYLDGTLKEKLQLLGITRIKIYIDWTDDIKCIDIQGRFKKYFADIQIYSIEFSISFDLIEPDDDVEHLLESREQVYSVISETIKTLN